MPREIAFFFHVAILQHAMLVEQGKTHFLNFFNLFQGGLKDINYKRLIYTPIIFLHQVVPTCGLKHRGGLITQKIKPNY